MKIAIVGTGYVGLVSGVCLAYKNHQVTCVDLRTEIVEQLNKGIPHIYENDLQEMLHQVISNKNFIATADIATALSQNDIIIVAVGTPSENGEIDLTQIGSVAKTIGEHIKTSNQYISVVIKSTVVPGTTDSFVKQKIEEFSGKKIGEFGLGMNPEFLREGNAIEDFLYPDRIVIGSEDDITKQRLEEIYSPWNCDKIFVNTRTAEMIKYANNTVLACLISLNNELANLSGLLGNIDYNDVVKGISADKRWSPILNDGTRITPHITSYFTPGAGFGGSCFPKDVQAIRTQGMNMGLPMKMTNAVLNVNDDQASSSLKILKSKIGSFQNKKILFLGLAFKPDTDDIRESSAIKILNHLLKEGCKTEAHDPIAMEHVEKLYPNNSNLSLIKDWKKNVLKADIIIIGTNWKEYLDLLDFDRNNQLNDKIIFDSKRLFSKNDFVNTDYCTIGYNPFTVNGKLKI
ncbi:MAG TPA: UDP-glucose/GDP-mannose dehydrogenase family protein [Segetibacter sp.]|jgi:UDPglucose 6-dehydrogenase/GDP-mannose 6-dehydrogenase